MNQFSFSKKMILFHGDFDTKMGPRLVKDFYRDLEKLLITLINMLHASVLIKVT